MKYLYEKGYPSSDEDIMLVAARYGHLDIIEYMCDSNNYPLHEEIMNAAVDGGYIDVVKYLYEKGCTFSPETITLAATNGEREILKYLAAVF